MGETSRIVVAEGAWAAEAAVVAELERRLPPGRLAGGRVVAVVPSRSLREHLLGVLAARRGAWLGLEVTTLAALAAAILERGGERFRSGGALVPLLVRRLAARERALAGPLGPLVDGYDEIGGAVRDLLDAGFVEEHLDAVEERLALERATAGAAAVERAQAIARVAAEVRRELAAAGLAPPSDLLAAATQRLVADPAGALPAAVVVHGFADLTGVGSDFIEAVFRHRTALVVFDDPPELDGRPAEWRFGRRLRERLASLASIERIAAARRAPPPVAFTAADPPREARVAVGWLADRPADVAWERCALVARESDGELASWQRELDRQGLPFSAESGAVSPRRRLAAGIVELLTRRAETPLGVALAVGAERIEAASGARIGDLRLAFALLGARTLGAAARLAPGAEPVSLPLPDRFDATPEGGAMVWREVAPAGLAGAVRILADLLAGIESMQPPRALGARLAELPGWLATLLPAADAEALARALAELDSGELARFEVEADEWRRLLEAAWSETLEEPTGAGGGIALLSVTGARGRTFDRVALVGMTRDRFPRPVRSDALLPDALRLRLRDLLPDLPVKGEGHEEERFLFAQLVAAARELALLRPIADGQGRKLPPSPLLDELLRGNGARVTAAPPPPRTSALDAAVAAALSDDPGATAPALAAAIDEARDRFGDPSRVASERLADARLALLARRSGDPAEPGAHRLGPYLGAVGPPSAADPRRRPASVTALERLAGCGWRLFLERVLRLAPLPELVEGLPSLPGRLAGNVVHQMLEEMHPEARGGALAEALGAAPRDVAWPDPERWSRRLRVVARRHLAAEGLDPALFEETLAREASALLEVARAHDWPDGHRELLAVEASGEAEVQAGNAARRIPFRVDRVERRDGELLLTDYKTGRPLSTGVRPSTRARHLAERIVHGEALQLPVYLLGAADPTARARYLYLDPGLDDRARELALSPAELASLPLAPTLDALFAAWDAGAFVPRLVERDLRTSYSGCAHCDVREACVQGDSAARQRQARWAAAAPAAGGWEKAARDWWQLRKPPRRASGEEAT